MLTRVYQFIWQKLATCMLGVVVGAVLLDLLVFVFLLFVSPLLAVVTFIVYVGLFILAAGFLDNQSRRRTPHYLPSSVFMLVVVFIPCGLATALLIHG